MKIEVLHLGAYAANCYLVEQDQHLIVFDPAARAQRIIEKLNGRRPEAVVLTHGHFDHIGAVDDLVREYACPVYLHAGDKPLLQDTRLNSLSGMSATVSSVTRPLKEGRTTLGGIEAEIIEAPGHTPGSVLIVISNDCFCGDVLFEGSIGRTDLPLGCESDMRQTLKLIKTLNPELRLYPGHGPATTLETELKTNPFLMSRR